jgi:hypothetical protein
VIRVLQDTSLAEAPAAQALVARLGSNVLDDNLVDDNPDLLNFDAAESETICGTSSDCRGVLA